VFEDTVPALQRLRIHGSRNVILSNHVPELGDLVDDLGLRPYVEDVVCSAVTGYEKPHPQAFAAALGLRQHGEAIWMVGDNPQADVAGARRAGLEATLVRTNGVGLDAAADRILAS
jgi:putative hydrolase of the HAD superfamily